MRKLILKRIEKKQNKQKDDFIIIRIKNKVDYWKKKRKLFNNKKKAYYNTKNIYKYYIKIKLKPILKQNFISF